MLEISNIHKNFNKVIALNNVSCNIESGNVTGILGQNGAGKTTLLKIIGGLLKSECGHVHYQNKPIKQSDIAILMGGDVGLYPKLTAKENILYFADLHHIDHKIAEEYMFELANEFQLTEYLNRNAEGLSRGTKQKVSIIRAVIHKPEIILFDEPETGLDFDAAKSIASFLKRSAAAGKTVIYSSHSIGNILAVCHDAFILHHGEIVEHCLIDELQQGCTSSEAQDAIYRIVMNIGCDNKGVTALHE